MRRQGNYIIFINILKARHRHWNDNVKTEKPEQKLPHISY
jgi:hypothetical protein